ncbi:hypothetical protein BU24DRAFT_498038 [Aaosphaeria arxii CBS 175.79]|uniref:Integral membrane protein n=1 Tax=Aaosphaeria arxii CBS 175.79 TaxID=1450172 RepID=A0A6A5X5S5_9PLEO|nr:uncharacterized protein BU24DRAFT_498038 [Aaosphaeria arxii CBS 175.79]KAF2008345.1 hypothetical protein BU24DRAFT_498038 [Aaosphaeria arxii CBS 175.79]
MLDQRIFIPIIWTTFVISGATNVARFLVLRPILSVTTIHHFLSHFSILLLGTGCAIDTYLAFHTDRIRLSGYGTHLQYASTVLKITSTWLAKCSLMVSYHRLIDGNIPLHRAWYAFVSTSIAAYVAGLAAYPYVASPCVADCIFPGYTFSYRALWLSTVWDVVSSCVLIVFPMAILLSARIQRRTKLLAATRFSLIGLCVVISVVRAVTSYKMAGLAKVFWLHQWDTIHNGVFLFTINFFSIRARYLGKSTHNRIGTNKNRHTTASLSNNPPTPGISSRMEKAFQSPQSHVLHTSPIDRGRPSVLRSTFSWSSSESHPPPQIGSTELDIGHAI